MIFTTKTVTLKDGRAATLRAPALTDAAEMLAYIKTCCAETDFLARYPEEYGDSMEAEEAWIRRMIESPAVLPIVCEVEGRIVGSCEVRFLGGDQNLPPRCAGHFGPPRILESGHRHRPHDRADRRRPRPRHRDIGAGLH